MENSPPPANLLERQQSIKNEPKTLFGDEINLAREAALEVINSNTPDLALKIFLKGLEPVKISGKTLQWENFDFEQECEGAN